MQTTIEKRFLFTLLIIVLVLTLAIFYPFLTTIILAIAFAVILSPVYNWIKKYIKNPSISSLVTLLLFMLILCIPLLFIGAKVFEQTQITYNHFAEQGVTNNLINSLNISINKIIPTGFDFDIHEKVNSVLSFVSANIANFFASTFNTLAMFALMIFAMFYLLKDGEKWKNNFIKFFPMPEENTKEILNDLKDSINKIIKGSLFIAIIQGILSFIGLSIFGVPNAIIWGVIAGIASFVPTLGTSIVTVPAMIFLYFSGMQLQAIGLLIWAIVIVSTVDNILAPYVISKDTKISSIFILFSILGGIALLGPVGLIIGPLMISLLYSLMKVYKKGEN